MESEFVNNSELQKALSNVIDIKVDYSTLNMKNVVKGYDFNKGVDYDQIFESYLNNGIQSTHLYKAIKIINKALKDRKEMGKDFGLLMGISTSVLACGVRNMITFICRHKLVDIIVTTGGGVKHDVLKCLSAYKISDTSKIETKDKFSKEGNIIITESNDKLFDEFMNEIFDEMVEKEEKDKISWTPSKIIDLIGSRIKNEKSFIFWAHKNKIPVYCPAILDGRIGDVIYQRFKDSKKNPKIDVVEDIHSINSKAVNLKKSAGLVLGGGIVKHHVFNANLMRNGSNYTVIINTGMEYDASDSGAKPTEALSWGKIRLDGEYSKISGEVSLIFPMLFYQSFYDFKKRQDDNVKN